MSVYVCVCVRERELERERERERKRERERARERESGTLISLTLCKKIQLAKTGYFEKQPYTSA